MIGVIAGFILGLLLALVAFWLSGGGVIGLVLALVCAVLGYVAGSILFQPERRLGKVVVSALPNGQQAADAIDEANRLLARVNKLTSQIYDPRVRAEANDFLAATNDLTRYVATDTGAYATLRHYTNVYGEQTVKLLKNYLDVERSGAHDQIATAQHETVEALQVLEQAAAGELSRAVSSKTLGIAADSEAIQRLASMDGYEKDPDADPTPHRDYVHEPVSPFTPEPLSAPAAQTPAQTAPAMQASPATTAPDHGDGTSTNTNTGTVAQEARRSPWTSPTPVHANEATGATGQVPSQLPGQPLPVQGTMRPQPQQPASPTSVPGGANGHEPTAQDAAHVEGQAS